MNALWMKLVRGTEHPDLVVADAEVYATYESGLQENQRYADASSARSASRRSNTRRPRSSSTAPPPASSGGYFLNTKYLKFEIYSGRNFEKLDLPDQSPDMDAITKHIGFMGALTLSNRAMQGRLIVLTGT